MGDVDNRGGCGGMGTIGIQEISIHSSLKTRKMREQVLFNVCLLDAK